MNRKLWPSALLALCTFVIALCVGFKSPGDRRPGEAWTKFEAANIQSLKWTSSDKTVEVLPLGGSSAWIKSEGKGKAELFLAGSRMRDLYFALSPIWSSKNLGVMTKKKKDEYGFSKEEKTFRIVLRDGEATQEFQIGSRGFQSNDYFVFDRAKQRIFLWNREALDLIQDPGRLMMKDLQFLDPETINRIGIETEGSPALTRELLKTTKLWTEKGRPLNLDDPIFPWLEALSKLSIKGYRTRSMSSPKPLLHFVLTNESPLDLRIFHEAETNAYFLDFGEGKPQILLDSAVLSPLLEQWSTGKIAAKNGKS